MEPHSDDDMNGLAPLREPTESPADPILGYLDEGAELTPEIFTQIHRKIWESYQNFQKSASEVVLEQLSRRLVGALGQASNDQFLEEMLARGDVIDRDPDIMMDVDVDGPSHDNDPIETIYCDDLTEKKIGALKVETQHVMLESLLDTGDNTPQHLLQYIKDVCKEHPRYESVTPLIHNVRYNGLRKKVQLGSHKVVRHILEFLPSADKEEFDIKFLQRKYRSGFAWQTHWRDPDVDNILVQAARKIHYIFGVSPRELSSFPGFSDLNMAIQRISQREPILWSDEFHTDKQSAGYTELRNRATYSEHDLAPRLEKMMEVFCPQINCHEPNCRLHKQPKPIIKEVKPKKQNSALRTIKLRSKEPNPCGENCFLHLDEDNENGDNREAYWSPMEHETFKTLLKMMPDELPCDLAIISHLPCSEVFLQREKDLDTERILYMRDKHDANDSQKHVEKDDDILLDPPRPCSHAGPCGVETNCKCFKKGQYCSRNCSCSKSCKNRWKGCRCNKPKKTGLAQRSSSEMRCKSETCPCRKIDRECEPGVCYRCIEIPCMNTVIQRGDIKELEIKPGSHGLGAFAVDTIKQDDYIGEYLAELVPDQISSIWTYPRVFNKLNYLFDYNSAGALDAIRAGNEIRYMNHQVPSNCMGRRVQLVNGEHRLGIYATQRIRPGAELFLDYGVNYWNEEDPTVSHPDEALPSSSDGTAGI